MNERERERLAKKCADERCIMPRDRREYNKPRPTDQMLAERDRRLTAPRSLGAALMGDPPVGYSALDKGGA